MSDMASKLEPQYDGPGKARQTLKSLKVRWGVTEPDDWKKCEIIMVKAMGYTEVWRRVSGAGNEATYELSEKRHE